MTTRGHLPPVKPVTKKSLYRPSLNEMNEMQKRFVDEYIIDLNGTQAAIRAGYPSTKANSAAGSLMRWAPVREEIARRLAARSARVGLNAERVLQELGKLVVGDPRGIFNEDGTAKRPAEMDADSAAMVAGIKTRRVVEMGEDGKPVPVTMEEVRLVDRVGAIQLAMRHLGMMNDKLDINITSLADRMLAAQIRTGMKKMGVDIDGVAELDDDEQTKLQNEILQLGGTVVVEEEEADLASDEAVDDGVAEAEAGAVEETFEDLI